METCYDVPSVRYRIERGRNGRWEILERFLLGLFFMIYLFTAIGLSPGGSVYFTCKQNTKLVTTSFMSEGLHKKDVVATWNVGNRLSVCL